MDRSTQHGTVRVRARQATWRVLAGGVLVVLAGACASDPEPSAPFDGVAVARSAPTTTTTTPTTLAPPSSAAAPATTAPVPVSNDVALAPGAAAPATVPAPVVATAEATASSIDDTLAQVDALLDDVDRDLADASDS